MEDMFPYSQTPINQYFDPLTNPLQRITDTNFGGDMNYFGGDYGSMMFWQAPSQLSPMNRGGMSLTDFPSL